MAPVRVPGADHDAAREELRHVVPRVPADLHAARGRHGSLPEARPRLHRARRARGRDGDRARTAAGVCSTVDPDPDEPADVIGDEPVWHDGEVVGWVTSGAYAHYSGVSLALGYIPAELATPEAAAQGAATTALVSRSRSSGTGARPACSANRCSIRAVNECVRDGRVNDGKDRRPPSPHRTARRRRRAPRRARHRGSVVAADGEVTQCQCQRPGSSLRHEGRDGGRRVAAAPSMSRSRFRRAGRRVIRGSRKPSCSDGGGDGSTPRRRTSIWCDSGSRPLLSTRPRPDFQDQCALSRSGSGDRTSSNA